MKTKLFLTVALSVLTVIATGQTSQTGQQVQPGQSQVAANRGPGKGQGLAQCQRNGQGRHHGLAQGPGKRHPRGQAMKAGRGAGRGLHNGQGPAFIDANKDGICDNLATTPEKK
ncbi:MAG: hypothetical protein ACM3NP_05220 [Actinomycetota bacterium]